MLKQIATQYGETILQQAASLYGAEAGDLVELEGFENYIYCFARNGQNLVLRIGHTLHRSVPHTQAEIAWLNYLSDRELPVARPVTSKRGRWLEVIDPGHDQGCFVAIAFERAPGVILDDEPQAKARHWNAALFEQWGAVMGRLHRAATDYAGPAPPARRQEWHEYDVLTLERFVPEEQTAVYAHARDLMARLHILPTDRASYGLIHADLTQWNFVVHEGQLTVFDFDSSEYAWFAKDIAVSLYYAVHSDERDRSQFVPEFLSRFMKGYWREYDLAPWWLEQIPDLLRLQRLILYSFSYQLVDPSSPDPDAEKYIAKTRTAIEQDRPVLEFDFAGWRKEVAGGRVPGP
jgi:Ser/Thr protein kinase RdoA (MazF antagonist)